MTRTLDQIQHLAVEHELRATAHLALCPRGRAILPDPEGSELKSALRATQGECYMLARGVARAVCETAYDSDRGAEARFRQAVLAYAAALSRACAIGGVI